MAVFNPSRDSIQAWAWQYSSTGMALFKQSHDSIQAHRGLPTQVLACSHYRLGFHTRPEPDEV